MADILLDGGSILPNTGMLATGYLNKQAPLVGGRVHQRMNRGNLKRTLASWGAKADAYGAPSVLADVTTTDSFFGSTNAVEWTLPNTHTASTIAPLAVNAVPTNVTGGIIRLWFKPISNLWISSTFQIDGFTVELHSAGTPASPTANFHGIDKFGVGVTTMKQIISVASGGTGAGRWQSIAFPVSLFSAASGGGTGADLTSILFARVYCRTVNGTTVKLQVGQVEYVPNSLTKAKFIIGFDDGWLSQGTYAAPLMAKYGFKGVLYPSPISTLTDYDTGRLTSAQIRSLHDNLGWQIASQAWSTEVAGTIDGMTENQFTAELARVRNWQNANGLTGGSHGSYFSGVGVGDMIAYPSFRKHFRSMRAYYGGNASGNPFSIPEMYPWGDPMNIRALNGNTPGWATPGTNLVAHAQQAIDNIAVGAAIWHNDFDVATSGYAGFRTGFETLLTFLDANRSTIDVVTEEEISSIG